MDSNTSNQGIQMTGGQVSAENLAVGNNARAIKNMNETNLDKSNNINIGGTPGSIGSIVAGQDMTGVASGNINGNLTQNIGQSQEEAPEAPKLDDLLQQLQAVIEADPHLSPDDKKEALEQVKALAEAGKKPQDGAMQKAAKSAMRMLRGIISELPGAAKLAEEAVNLLPTIAKLLSLGI